jgi:hypothetical protein
MQNIVKENLIRNVSGAVRRRRDVLPPQPAFPAIRRTDPVCCPVCGRIVARKTRQQRFCSDRCRERSKESERGKERSRKALMGWHTGAPTEPLKKANNFSRFEQPKSGSSIARKPFLDEVIEAEVFGGREWRQVTSSDGVVCQVSTLRPRALQDGSAS